MNDYIAIIDLGLSNLYNVKLACDKINLKSKFISDNRGIYKSKALILPGVGAFSKGIENLKKMGFYDEIINFKTKSNLMKTNKERIYKFNKNSY